MEEMFKAISLAITEFESHNSVVVGCYLTINNYGTVSGETNKYEFNGETFKETPNLVIYKKGN